jgi:hypothetical protein
MSVTEEQKLDRFGRDSSPSPKASGLGIGPLQKMNQDMIIEEQSIVEADNTVVDDLRSASSMCRICFSEESEKEDPLISPCKCSGTMQYVHLKCLRQWLSRNENKKVAPHVTSYTWKAFHCELCKAKLEDHFTHGKRSHQIFEIQKPHKNFMVIESFQVNSPEQDHERQKQLHVINFNNTDKIRLGRGHDTDVRIHDISVSRLHAHISKDEFGRVYIEDNSSKFGTLVQI